MKIEDIDGKEIKVTDWDLAMMQADDYRHVDPAHAAGDKRLQAYWEAIYQKLLKLKNE